MAQVSNTRTRFIKNTTGTPMIIEFPLDDDSVTGNLQVYVYDGIVEFKGAGRLLGAESEYIVVPVGTSMNVINLSGNNLPTGKKTIRIAPTASISLIAYD